MKDYSKIDLEIKRINLVYENKIGCCISFIITDDIDTKEYIKKAISSIDIDTILDDRIVNYNFCEKLEEENNNIKNFQKLCQEKGNLVVATGIGEYVGYLVKNGKIPNRAAFYQSVFCMPRDSFYLKNDVRLILLVNESEMKEFKSPAADDFTSYAMQRIYIDDILREEDINER